MFDGSIPDSSNDGELIGFLLSPTIGFVQRWLVLSFRVRERGEESDSSKGSGNEPCRCANPTPINGMRGSSATSEACVKCPRPPDRSPSLNLRFREKRLASQPPPSRRAQALKSPPNRVFYEFSLRAEFPLTSSNAHDNLPKLIIIYALKAKFPKSHLILDTCFQPGAIRPNSPSSSCSAR